MSEPKIEVSMTSRQKDFISTIQLQELMKNYSLLKDDVDARGNGLKKADRRELWRFIDELREALLVLDKTNKELDQIRVQFGPPRFRHDGP